MGKSQIVTVGLTLCILRRRIVWIFLFFNSLLMLIIPQYFEGPRCMLRLPYACCSRPWCCLLLFFFIFYYQIFLPAFILVIYHFYSNNRELIAGNEMKSLRYDMIFVEWVLHQVLVSITFLTYPRQCLCYARFTNNHFHQKPSSCEWKFY